MANKQQRQQLYEWFETGDRPSQLQFEDFIDSMINQQDDDIWVDDEELFNGQTNPYQGFIGIGNRQPVTKLSLSGSMIIGAGWASDRVNVPSQNVPDDGMLIEGSVKIGTKGPIDPGYDPDAYRLEIKNKESGQTNIKGSRPLRIDSDNHDMIVFSDTNPVGALAIASQPYTLLEEGGRGFSFYSWAGAADNRESVRITKDGKVGINLPGIGGVNGKTNPVAQVDIQAENNLGVRIETTGNDVISFAGTGNASPFSIVDESNRGFRFYSAGTSGSGQNLRIAPNGDVAIGTHLPQYKLHVDGHIALNEGGHIYGKRQSSPLSIISNTNATNGSYIELHPWDDTTGATELGHTAFVAVGNNPETGWSFVQNRLANGWNEPVKIKNDGKVGINIPDMPSNQLDIRGAGSDTGLRLRTGAAPNMVLKSDGDGNASWAAISTFAASGLVPTRAIIMWSGSVSQRPAGWWFCDGTTINDPNSSLNGEIAPDLKGRFIVGHSLGNTDYDPIGPKSIGQEKVTLSSSESGVPAHDHSHDLEISDATVDLWFHTWAQADHLRTARDNDFVRRGHLDYAQRGTAGPNPMIQQNPHSHQITGGIQGLNGGAQDAQQPHENRPPYYVLAFLIKI